MSEELDRPGRPPDPPVGGGDAELGEVLKGPSPEEARESLGYWQHRLDELPVHKRAERREARELIARWQERVDVAERERYGPSPFQQLLSVIGLRRFPTRALVTGFTVVTVIVLVLVIALVVALVAYWGDVSPVVHDLLQQGGGDGGG